jgi:hypothetical protein
MYLKKLLIFIYKNVCHEIYKKIIWIYHLNGEPDPALNLMGMGMGKKSPQLLNGDGDEKTLPGGAISIPKSTPS